MSKTFLISDTHFRHKNILSFKKQDGSSLRPHFNNIVEHDEWLIENWNRVVGVKDKVYHLGDVGFFNATSLYEIMNRLNGNKVLIKGNHDNLKLNQYSEVFKDVRAYHILDKFVLSHVPIHSSCLYRWKANIHGHLHYNHVGDPKYYNVSVEAINFTPIDFEYIRSVYAN